MCAGPDYIFGKLDQIWESAVGRQTHEEEGRKKPSRSFVIRRRWSFHCLKRDVVAGRSSEENNGTGWFTFLFPFCPAYPHFLREKMGRGPQNIQGCRSSPQIFLAPHSVQHLYIFSHTVLQSIPFQPLFPAFPSSASLSLSLQIMHAHMSDDRERLADWLLLLFSSSALFALPYFSTRQIICTWMLK